MYIDLAPIRPLKTLPNVHNLTLLLKMVKNFITPAQASVIRQGSESFFPMRSQLAILSTF